MKTTISDDSVNSFIAFMRQNHTGRDRAITNAALARLMDMPDCGKAGREGYANSKQLTTLVKLARKRGCPICADKRGFYVAEYFRDITATFHHFISCADAYTDTALALKAAAAGLPDA